MFIFQNFVEDGCNDRRNVEKSENVPLILNWLRMELRTKQLKFNPQEKEKKRHVI